MYQLVWATEYPDIWLSMVLDVSVGVFLCEVSMSVGLE